jgi:hypothetical protein
MGARDLSGSGRRAQPKTDEAEPFFSSLLFAGTDVDFYIDDIAFGR